MNYLRFSPDDYQLIARLCWQLNLGGHPQAAFKRLLVEALSDHSPSLAKRIARLRRDELGLLHEHFREQPRSVTGSDCPTGPGHDLTAEELIGVAEACVAAPFQVRFVRPFKGVLVELFEESWPELSRKLAGMSGYQFERLYERASQQSRRNA